MMTKRLISTVYMLTMAVALSWAQPNNTGSYYAAANGKKGQALKTAMFEIIKIEKAGWTYDGLKTAYKTTDTRPDGYLRDWYSKITNYEPGSNCAGSFSEEGDGYNREHLVPQSWFSKKDPMRCDAFHVVPTDAKVNNMRSDNPFGEVGTITNHSYNNYCKLGKAKDGLGYTGTVFEPGDDVKGDIARAYFYMATCYQDKISSWASNATASYVFDGNTYPGLTNWTLEMMIRWSAEDPVDNVEKARNEAIYNKQRNRNPFIDYPGLEEYIWGTMTNVEFDYTNGQVTYVTPPTFSPAGGTYTTTQSVTLSCAINGASIYYTTDGTTPSASSTPYEGAITISTTTTLKVIAIKDNVSSEVVEATYTIEAETPIPSSDTLVWESFSGYTGADDSNSALSTDNNKLDYKSWTSFTKVYFGQNGCGKLGSSSATGSMEATGIQLSGNGVLTFKVKRYGSDTGKLNVTITGATTTGDKQVTPPDNWTQYTINLTNATGNVGITFATSSKRAYIDDIKLVSANTPGDVNNDGFVNVTDVTALVNIVLGKDNTAPYIYNHVYADVNGDKKVDITDVTELVNMVLAGGNSN